MKHQSLSIRVSNSSYTILSLFTNRLQSFNIGITLVAVFTRRQSISEMKGISAGKRKSHMPVYIHTLAVYPRSSTGFSRERVMLRHSVPASHVSPI